jgi:hypothetical protein
MVAIISTLLVEFGANQVQTLAALPNSEIFEFLKVLDIKKMFVKGEQNIEIAPILITANNKQLTLKITVINSHN